MYIFPLQCQRATQTACYLLSSAYGFQQFNYSPASAEWVAASAGLAADGIVALLRDAAVRCASVGGREVPMLAAWVAAIADVHAEYFEEYESWRQQLALPAPPPPSASQQRELLRAAAGAKGAAAAPLQLLELALQALIYSEAANLRHTPHVLFLLFHVLRSSTPFQQCLDAFLAPADPAAAAETAPSSSGSGHAHTHWLYWLQLAADDFPGPPNGHNLTSLRRNLLHQMYLACPPAFHFPDPSAPNSAAEQALINLQQQEAALDAAVDGLLAVTSPQHRRLVRSTLAQLRGCFVRGSQQVFLNKVVQPLFFFLAEQIDLAGQQGGEEAALRVAYCDVDEAACSPRRVHAMLAALQGRQGCPDMWAALCQAMEPPSGWLLAMQTALQPQAAQPAGLRGWLRRTLGRGGSRQQQQQQPGSGTAPVKDRYPRAAPRVVVLENLALLLQRSSHRDDAARIAQDQREALRHVTATCFPALTRESESLTAVYKRAKHGADWWAAHLFTHKSFVEARSLAAPFVAFWRVYCFHAVLLTAMVAVALVWRLKPAGPEGWLQLLAALLSTTVVDCGMRAARAAAHLLLLSYRAPVTRWQKQAGRKAVRCTLSPFPRDSWRKALAHATKLLWWLLWGGVLGFAVVPVLLRQPIAFAPALLMELHSMQLWLLPPALHALLLWAGALARQRAGYTTSWAAVWRGWRSRRRGRTPAAAAAVASAKPAGVAHADCAADGCIDALFFPASNLAVDGMRSGANAALWLLVVALKVAFEFFCVVMPLTGAMLEILHNKKSYLEDAMQGGAGAPPSAAQGLLLASQATTIAVMALPMLLLSFSDTGLLFSLVGGLVSAVLGFRRGVGGVKTWSELVTCFGVLLDGYKQHCVSRSALTLHLHGGRPADRQQLCLSSLAAGWNALALDLRQRDLLSTRELACLLFEQLQLTDAQLADLRRQGLTTVLPARCFIAGAVPELAGGALGCEHHFWVASTVWTWLCWLLWQTGLIEQSTKRSELSGLLTLKLLQPPATRKQQRRWGKLLGEAVRLLQLLSKAPASPSNTSAAAATLAATAAGAQAGGGTVAGSGGGSGERAGLLHALPSDEGARARAWKELTSCLGELVKLLNKEVSELAEAVQERSSRASSSCGHLFGWLPQTRSSDANALDVRNAQAALASLTERWAPQMQQQQQQQSLSAATSLQQQQGRVSRHDDSAARREQVLAGLLAAGAASPAVAQVAGWLGDALTLLQGDTTPADEEAQKFILSFASSLNDPQLKTAPALHEMPSMTTLTPHYDEDVIYALTEDDALAEVCSNTSSSSSSMVSRDKMVYLMTPEGSPTATMTYLRSLYCQGHHAAGQNQWGAFVERLRGMAAQRGIDAASIPADVSEFHFLPGEPLHPLKDELLLWASCRGQLLARTVRGMMSYRAALAALAEHENPQLSSSGAAGTAAGAGGGGAEQQQALSPGQAAALRQVVLGDLVDAKYSYVVSSQNLGEFASKAGSDLRAGWLVHSLRLLRRRYPTLKVAFIDKQPLVTASRPGHRVELRRDCSVLLATARQQALDAATGAGVRGRQQQQQPDYEAYRVQLPINFESGRGVILGEGKPENQNHAAIFCHGEALQTIDCNQDNVVAEGLKLRNLLAELLPDGWDEPAARARGVAEWLRHGFDRLSGLRGSSGGGSSGGGRGTAASERQLRLLPRGPGRGRVALLGFREWIFSEDSGALAEFAAATERSFGTTVQRLMHNPGACRFHYGHPDVWRRSFVATCGGVSKANKGLHVSEDVFGGYNVVLRGRDVAYVDYIGVGKGRDMGFETINTFEAKIAAGNGEQVLSREIRRLGHCMDFARLMTWYHTGNGFFINTALTMLSVHASLWVLLLLAFEEQRSPAIQSAVSAVQLLQLGSLSVIVYGVTLVLEAGLFEAVWVLLRQMLQGSLLFYVFRAQTSAHAFTADLLYGGAKYAATGRGYKLAHTRFTELWKRYGRSHMYFGAVLLQYCLAVIAAGKLGGSQLLVLWAPALVVLALLLGPFWFTPFAFRTENVMADLKDVQQWLTSPSLTDSWSASHRECADVASDASGKQLGRLPACLRAHAVKLPTLMLLAAAISRLDARQDTLLPKWAIAVVLAGGALLMVAVIQASSRWSAASALRHQAPRLISSAATIALAAGVAVSGFATSGNVGEFGNGLLVLFGAVLLLRLLPLVYFNPALRPWAAGTAAAVYYAADAGLALLLNGLRFLLSLFDILTSVQAQLLFNTAYARQVMADASMESSQVPRLVRQALRLKRQRRLAQLAAAEQQQHAAHAS